MSDTKTPLFAAALCAIATALPAELHNTPANLAFTCNAHGVKVEDLDTGRVFYLGKDKDAFEAGVGSGRWWWAASAFVVEISCESTRYANDLKCAAD